MPTTTVTDLSRKTEERILAGVRKSHSTILEAAESIAKPIERVVPVGPKLSLPKGVPTTQEAVDSAFAFTLKLVEAQRGFAQELLATASPVLRKLTGHAPKAPAAHTAQRKAAVCRNDRARAPGCRPAPGARAEPTRPVFPDRHALTDPHKAAYVVARTGERVTYAELTERSRRGARVLRACGAQRRDSVAFLLPNHRTYLELAWAAQRAGLRYTTLSPRFTVDETAYILRDANVRVLVVGRDTAAVGIAAAAEAGVERILTADPPHDGLEAYHDLAAREPAVPLDDEAEGVEFLYSSGTTGRPKAISTELSLAPLGTPPPLVGLLERLYGFGPDTVYLSPAPLYHSAPLRFTMAVNRLGGTAVIMDHFDPEWTLELIDRYRVTHAQMVPTMFVRLLRLPEGERRRWRRDSLRKVVHAAAPCPDDVKLQMIEWLGPIVDEYYSSTEIYLFTAIDAHEWLSHPGSVGRPLIGTPHILDDEGDELPAGAIGTIWSEGGTQFAYHNDPEKTAGSRNRLGWTTVGDLGRLDADGYLYLSDRRADLIISGGVNIYPREAEDALISHPAVLDAAVFGASHDELGQEVRALVQLVRPAEAGDRLAGELIAYLHGRLAKYKCPRTIEFVTELPRHATGKLYKRLLRDGPS